MFEKQWSLILGSANYAQEIQNLKRENNQLKEQVEQWKGKLISAEKSSGIQQITTSVPEAGEPQQAKSDGRDFIMYVSISEDGCSSGASMPMYGINKKGHKSAYKSCKKNAKN